MYANPLVKGQRELLRETIVQCHEPNCEMLKLIGGFVFGAIAASTIGAPWILAAVFLAAGIAAQASFARALDRAHQHVDPFAMGARSVLQLKALGRVSGWVVVLDFAAKTLLWASVPCVLAALE